jgi:hypothetical protein
MQGLEFKPQYPSMPCPTKKKKKKENEASKKIRQ